MSLSTPLSPNLLLRPLASAFVVVDKRRAAPLVEQWKRPLTLTAYNGGDQ